MFVWSKLSAAKWADAWEERFYGASDLQTVITEVPGRKTVRVEVYCRRRRDALDIQRLFGGTVRPLRSRNWAAMAPPPPDPIRVRDRLVICATRSASEAARLRKKFPGREIILVPPELAFGTGHHVTTATMLRFLTDAAAHWRRQRRAWDMLDLGCGSGILAIAAAKLGAKRVWGCDFDPQAVKVARENLARNRAGNVSIVKQDVLKWQPRKRADLVAANIFADLLTAVFPKLALAVKPDGVVLISGILRAHAEDCLAAGRQAGFHFEKVVRRGKWISALGRLRAA